MKVSSVFIVVAAIVTGQASAQLAITGRRPGTKQRKALKGEVRRLQKNDASSLSRSQSESMADSFVVSEKSDQGKPCSIEDMGGATFTTSVDLASHGCSKKSGRSGYGYISYDNFLTLTVKKLGRVSPTKGKASCKKANKASNKADKEGSKGGEKRRNLKHSPHRKGKGSMEVNFCLDDRPVKHVAVQTGFDNNGIVSFILTPISIPTTGHPGSGSSAASSESDASAGSFDEKPDENGQGERRTERVSEAYLEYLQFTIHGEYNCWTNNIMFGGSNVLGYSFATNEPAQGLSTQELRMYGDFDENGCVIPPLISGDEQHDADWD